MKKRTLTYAFIAMVAAAAGTAAFRSAHADGS